MMEVEIVSNELSVQDTSRHAIVNDQYGWSADIAFGRKLRSSRSFLGENACPGARWNSDLLYLF